MKNIFVALLFFLASTSAFWKEFAEFLGPKLNQLFTSSHGIDYNVQLQHYIITGKVDKIKDLLKNPKVVPNSASLVEAAMIGNTEALQVGQVSRDIDSCHIDTVKRRKSKSTSYCS